MTFNVEETGAVDPLAPTGQPNQQPGTLDKSGQSADNGITPEVYNELLKRDGHAQQHIVRLENENKEIRDNFIALQEKMELLEGKLTSQKKLEELLTGKTTSTQQPDQGTNNNMSTPTTPIGLDQAAIDAMISARMQEHAKQQEQEKNYTNVRTALGTLFKDKADDHVRTVAATNGLTYEAAEALAKSNPTLFENVFISPYKTGTQQTPTPTRGTQSTSATPAAQQGGTDMNYWNDLRRKNPTKFQSVEVQKQFHKWFHENKTK